MNEESYIDSDEIEEMPEEIEIDLLDVLENIQRQLTFLEKKVDLLLSRTEDERRFDNARPAPRPFRKPYDKPAQRFDRPPRREWNDDRERGNRDRDFSSDRRFDGKPGKKPGGKPRPGYGKPGPRKKPFYSRFDK